jgi:hypothetical protein
VHARQASRFYRAKKFAGRHRFGVVAAAMLLLSMCTGFGIAVWQAGVARNEASRAEAAKRFVVSLFSNAVPRTGVGGVVLASDLLVAATGRIEKELADDPRSAAELGMVIGHSFSELGTPRLGQAALTNALARSRETFGDAHPTTTSIKTYLGQAIFSDNEKAQGASTLLDEAIRDGEALLPKGASELSLAFFERGHANLRDDNLERADDLFDRGLEVARDHIGENSQEAIALLSAKAESPHKRATTRSNWKWPAKRIDAHRLRGVSNALMAG